MLPNDEMVDYLVSIGALHSPHIVEAMRFVDRRDFVPEESANQAYLDRPLAIGFRQTISQPRTVAMMLEWLEPRQGQSILDIGSGSGYTTALLAKIVGDSGRVFGLEIKDELVAIGKHNLAKYAFENVKILKAGKELGLKEAAPFERILVSAAAQRMPEKLLEQLATDGKMIIPVKQVIREVFKDDNGEILTIEHLGFSFVPLITPN